MGSIISVDRKTDHVVLSVKINKTEWLELNGKLDNLHMIPLDNATTKSTVFERGRGSKYFLIPKSLWKNLKLTKEVSCARINDKDKVLWVYFMNKIHDSKKR